MNDYGELTQGQFRNIYTRINGPKWQIVLGAVEIFMVKSPSRRPAVALLIETSNAYARGILEGVISFIGQHHPWSIYLPEQERGAKPPNWLRNWRGNGIIARIETDDIATAVRRLKVPVVDVSAARHLTDIPWVETDDQAIAELAANHLIERGFRELAFCGESDFNWSNWRQEHFARRVIAAGCNFHLHNSTPKDAVHFSWARERQRLASWVRQLPKPVGIMACYDIKAQQLLDVCRDIDVAVPEEVAVIGVDNDSLLCDLANPPLSSVTPDAQRSGYEAARLLAAMMRGENVPAVAHLIEPLGVATRQSTNILAIDDPHVAKALRYIREHVFDGINVADVVRATGITRRILESRFLEIIGRSPHDEIVRLRIARVGQLLVQTDLTIQEIARRTGYEYVEYLSAAFKKETGYSPRAFRAQKRESKK